MTNDEHEILSLETRLIAQKNFLDFVSDILRIHYGLQPEPSRLVLLSALRQQFAGKQAQFEAGLYVPGAHPAMSDMQSSIYLEAYSDLSKEFMGLLEAGITGHEREHFKSVPVK